MPLPSFEDIWREHRRFIVAVGAGLIAFFAGLTAIWSVDADVDRGAKTNRRVESDIRSLVDEISGREGKEAGVALALERDLVPATREAVEFQPRPAFALKDGSSPQLVYRQAIEQVEAARKEALKRNISCPDDLGFVKDPPEDRVRAHIAGADLAERVLSALVAVGARSIEALRAGETEYVRLAEDSEKDAGPGDRAGAPPGPEPPVLRRVQLHFAATASLDSVEVLLSGFQRARSALELTGLRIARAGDGLVQVEADVAALTLVPAEEMKALKAAGAAVQRRGTRLGGGGRLR